MISDQPGRRSDQPWAFRRLPWAAMRTGGSRFLPWILILASGMSHRQVRSVASGEIGHQFGVLILNTSPLEITQMDASSYLGWPGTVVPGTSGRNDPMAAGA